MVKPGIIVLEPPIMCGDGGTVGKANPVLLSVDLLDPDKAISVPSYLIGKRDSIGVTSNKCDEDVAFSDEEDDDSGDEESEVSESNSQADIVANDDIDAKRKRSWLKKYRGMLLAVLSSLIFSVTALLVKKLSNFDPFNVALYKFQGALLPAIPLLLQKIYCGRKGKKVVDTVWPLTQREKLKNFGMVLLRSILTCNALLAHIYSLKYLPMGDALTISAASPVFVAILAKIFLGEKCGYSTFFASVISMIGVVAIAKPPVLTGSSDFGGDVMIGTCLAFGCTILSAVSFITLRYIRKVHYSVTTLSYGAWGSIENLVIVLILPGLKIPETNEEILLIIAMAALTLLGQFAIILAMKSEQAGPVVLVRTCDVLFAFILEMAVLKKLPDVWSIFGAVVIVLSVVFVGLRKWVRSLKKSHPIRKKLRFVLC